MASLGVANWARASRHRNHIGFASLEDADSNEAAFRAYWDSLVAMNRCLQQAGLQPVFLKTIRNFRYADNNVDVLIPRSAWSTAVAALCDASWVYPSRLIRAKQVAIESSKLKLYPQSAAMVPAHIYGGVNWRYQNDVGFLPGGNAARELITQVRLSDIGPEGEEDSILVPAPEYDLLLLAAQAVFEDYRLHLGEVLYINGLLEAATPAQFSDVERLARSRGFAFGFEAIMNFCRSWEGNSIQAEEVWPYWLPVSVLRKAWAERFALRRDESGWIPAVRELAGCVLFGTLYFALKRGRRAR